MSWTAVLAAGAAAIVFFALARRVLDIILAVALAGAVLLGVYAVAAHLSASRKAAGAGADAGADGRAASSGPARSAGGTAAGTTGSVRSGPAADRFVLHREPVPILMYHVLGTAPAGTPYPGLFLAPDDFRAEMAYLKGHGFRAVTLAALWDNWHRHRGTLPRKPVVITFDDGENAQLRVAEPILRSYHWPAVLNLVVDHYRVQPTAVGARAVKRLIGEGWEIDSHTVHHRRLTTLSTAELALEVGGSRQDLRRDFGVPASFFCYPAGFYDARVIAAVRRAGYLAATTTRSGLATRSGSAYELPRIRIDRGLPLATFAAEVSRGDFGGVSAGGAGD
jgi:peptidoglycan/xylan/chitin deacetylase (PgdA/CDA1 family)